MDLKDARLCLDCENIHDGATCPRCASRTTVPIATWIRPWLSTGPMVLDMYPGSPRDAMATKHFQEVGK